MQLLYGGLGIEWVFGVFIALYRVRTDLSCFKDNSVIGYAALERGVAQTYLQHIIYRYESVVLDRAVTQYDEIAYGSGQGYVEQVQVIYSLKSCLTIVMLVEY